MSAPRRNASSVQASAEGDTVRSAFSARLGPVAGRRLPGGATISATVSAAEAPVDRGADAAASENGGSGAANCGQRRDAHLRQRRRQRGQLRARREMRREARHAPRRRPSSAGRSARDRCQAGPAAAAGSSVAPISGKKPIAVSGMANIACSVATRYGAVHRHADAAAHADAVDQRDIGLRIGRDQQVERVFLAEERLDRRCGRRTAGRRAARGCRRRRRTRGRRRPRSPRHGHAGRRASPAAPAVSARIICRSSAFSACGRLSRMRPTRPSRRVITVSSVVMQGLQGSARGSRTGRRCQPARGCPSGGTDAAGLGKLPTRRAAPPGVHG